MSELHDVIIIGAGVSGIGMASRLKMNFPNKKVTILERRKRIGGTWDLFRYPGIRSDSDMYTFGFNFKPWSSFTTLADGGAIRNYLDETASDFDLKNSIHYNLKTESADWSSADQCWTISTTNEATGKSVTYRTRFLVAATGYYNYDKGYRPEFANESDFKGQIIHPQHWPENLDYAGKKVVVIGSGATAITLVPKMAKDAQLVTMLQRSPTYIANIPAVDKISKTLSKVLPDSINYKIARRRNVTIWRNMYKLSKRFPGPVGRFLVSQARKQTGDAFKSENFTPHYGPWDQRLCAAPDGDFFAAVKSGKAEVVTDTIAKFTEKGILLNSGKELEADIIVTATGLNLQLLGGMQVKMDGDIIDMPQRMMYRGSLIEGVPNFSWVVGYVNLSWTMKADLTSEYVCRLLKHMDKTNAVVATAPLSPQLRSNDSILGSLTAGYIQRSGSMVPRQGLEQPWMVTHNYEIDRKLLLREAIDDGIVQFEAPRPATAKRKTTERLVA